ncbi:hypothetical protein AC792_02980 [Arthrobacter sp. RIT-PI-e]|uniref:flagellar filament capping protein FliD n=1 Tax=Arthrobacter sp. RIT-PI-e TaxID=1681197 RepID=UPI000675D161|nr:flagellar filament capping protein FliD [Arthrobacter sp. RIT-PI-e]KNC20027.1 hypothetical protein AC792_02980 [Arthrobacter sp. RIT-PI-e]
MASSIDGIASGLQTKALIDQLMQVEARPQTLLKAKVNTTQGLVTPLQQLNTRLSSLTELATKTAKPAALDLYKASSSGDAAKATASSSARPGSLDFTVKQLAQSQSSVSAPLTSFPVQPSTLTLRTKDGTTTEVEITGSLDEVVAAVTKANVGITATKISVNKNADGEQQYRLQFTAKEPGAEHAFEVFRGTVDDIAAGTAIDFFAEPGAATVRAAQDAEVVLWGGTSAEQSVMSSSNTFAELLPGVDVTVNKVSVDPVSVTVAGDAEGTTAVAKELVDSLRSALSFISTNSAVTPGITATAKANAGKFVGDSMVRGIAQSVLSAATAPVDGRSTAEIGISLTRSGTVEFDEKKFTAALAANPDQIKEALTLISTRVAEAGKKGSDKFDGEVTRRIQSQESSIRSMNDRVADWGRSLDKRRATMERTYAALEVTLSKMQSQGNWLSSQIANIPSRSSY